LELTVQQSARFAFLSTAALFLTSAAFAQLPTAPYPVPRRTGILVTVTSGSDNTPVPFAQATLSSVQGIQVTSAVTAADGKFRMENLTVGHYTLTISAVGFETASQEIAIITGTTTPVSVSLRKGDGITTASDATGNIVSSRELTLPSKAQEALAKGRDLLYQRHDPGGSLPYFQKVLALAPGFYEAYYFQGIAFGFQGNTANAEVALRKSIAESKSEYAEPCFALASLLTNENRLLEAEELARNGLVILPEDWRGYFELARIQAMLGQYKDAEKNGIEARKRRPDSPGLYLVLASIHMQLHDNEALLDDINTFLKLDPNGPNSERAREIKIQAEHALGRSTGAPPSQNQ
jgi:hypothetical protein